MTAEQHDPTPDEAAASQPPVTADDVLRGKASVNHFRQQHGITDPPPVTAEQHDPTPDESAPARQRHRLAIRSSSGDPRLATIHLDGEQLLCVSRIELVLDSNGECEARLTVPAHLVDIDADVAAFVTAHAEPPPVQNLRAEIELAGRNVTEALAKGIAGAERKRPPHSPR